MSSKPRKPAPASPQPAGAQGKIQFLLHDAGDSVGVAVVDLTAGTLARGRALAGGKPITVKVQMDIPLGHKIALSDFKPGDTILKYGCDIGRIVAPVKRGEHVHVHNLKTKRW
jgi:(2R)-sulfolactate sulfo-lyase subunit alpha